LPDSALMHADGLKLLAPRIGDCGLAAIGEHDWCAVGRVQGIKLRSRRKLGSLRELLLHVLGADCRHIGDLAAPEQGEAPRERSSAPGGDVVVRHVAACHGTRLLCGVTRRALFGFIHCR